ncbi:MAG: hypothetical protein ABL977_10465 [Candidatus Eisenbacteria bacterium]
MKLSRSLQSIVLCGAILACAAVVHASTGCPDDPERCVERGAGSPHRAVAISNNVRSVSTPVPAAVAPAHKPVVAKPAPAAARKPAKPTRPAPSVSTPAPATPGMGMLLKMSGGSGGDVSWFPSRPVENSGGSWIL